MNSAAPLSTYRLQFNRDFTLDDAAALVPWLDALGVSHLYASPLLKARPGSAHGYDIVEHGRLNPELGGEAAFERLSEALRVRSMGLILDIVPNHMGVMGRDNPWWLDVLEHGLASPHAAYFDIDWNPLKDELRGKVLLPVLGDHYGNILDRGEIALVHHADGSFSAEYYEHRFPLDPREYPRLFAHREGELARRLGQDNPAATEFASLMTAFANLPARGAVAAAAREERARDSAIHKRRLAELRARHEAVAAYIDEVLGDYNGDGAGSGDPSLLHALLEAQAWRLAYWRVAADEINYRRFFDINDLAALAMEREEVFEATHGKILQLVADGRLQGLRIDHPDGLFDPAGYFARLQGAAAALVPADQQQTTGPGFYVIVEKILAVDEALPAHWPVHGTTGYDFARSAGGLFVDPSHAHEMDRIYRSFTFAENHYGAMEREARNTIMQDALASELAVLATELARIAEMDTHTRDFTRSALREAICAVVSCFPVYRTYVTAAGCPADDAARIESAVAEARRRAGLADDSLFDFLRDVLLARRAAGHGEHYRGRVIDFAMKFQQFTSPVAAKGVEDTTFYRYHRLVSLNEVGDAPDSFGTTVAQFHRDNAARRGRWPLALLAGSTHDAKRSLDVRMRIHALSGFPAEWESAVGRWSEINAAYKHEIEGRMAPSANDEYLFYQTLLGAWPDEDEPGGESWAQFTERLQTYMLKAAREAKLRTEWETPDPDYEAALGRFVGGVLDATGNRRFLRDFVPLQRRAARVGRCNSLAFLALQYTAPGVPDLYQGDELWNFRLVDPDNRAPVDFDCRRALLEALERDCREDGTLPPDVAAEAAAAADGRLRLQLLRCCLALRRRWPEVFAAGSYTPLGVEGERSAHVCAFMRTDDRRNVLTVVPRLAGALPGDGLPLGEEAWGDTRIILPRGFPDGILHHGCTGETPAAENGGLRVADALRHMPVGILSATRP